MRSGNKVLVVDDEENLRTLYREELESDGYAVRTAPDAASALKMIEEETPDVVVMDIRMPRMDGVEAMGLMLSRRSDLPVILNTAYSSYKDDFRSWLAEAYLIKSADMGELKRAIRRVIATRRPGA